MGSALTGVIDHLIDYINAEPPSYTSETNIVLYVNCTLTKKEILCLSKEAINSD